MEDSIQIIEQAIDAAIRKGVYTLQDMKMILAALESLKQ
jgi:hypothetical protein